MSEKQWKEFLDKLLKEESEQTRKNVNWDNDWGNLWHQKSDDDYEEEDEEEIVIDFINGKIYRFADEEEIMRSTEKKLI